VVTTLGEFSLKAFSVFQLSVPGVGFFVSLVYHFVSKTSFCPKSKYTLPDLHYKEICASYVIPLVVIA
jgi:hypothetical protein